MLSSANCGKLLSKRYAKNRNRAVRDKTEYSVAQQEYLDIKGIEGTGYFQHETYEQDTQPIGSTPINPVLEKKKIDIRKLPQTGGSI